jgi:hypothetical protein
VNIKQKKFDPEAGQYQFQLQFKPVVDDDEVRASVAVEVAFSVSENGELAELSFVVPKVVRNEEAMKFVTQQETAQCVDSHIFITVPEKSGDTVLRAPAELQLDAAGRIISLNVH